MLNIFNNSEEEKKFISSYSNPFKSDKVDKIEFTIGRKLFTENEIEYTASIRFKNGNSTGYQKIESSDFVSLVRETESFIKSL
jgi:hypothetical protein